MTSRSGLWQPIVIAGLTALTVMALNRAATDIGPWYEALQKPSWQPPGAVFGPVWTTIFVLTTASAVIAWRGAHTPGLKAAVVAAFLANAALNVMWSVLFFTWKRPDFALLELGLLWVSIVVLIVLVGRISRTAALLLLPYLAWVSFAGVLNWTIVGLNGPFGAA